MGELIWCENLSSNPNLLIHFVLCFCIKMFFFYNTKCVFSSETKMCFLMEYGEVDYGSLMEQSSYELNAKFQFISKQLKFGSSYK